jgi:hypothetical protein
MRAPQRISLLTERFVRRMSWLGGMGDKATIGFQGRLSHHDEAAPGDQVQDSMWDRREYEANLKAS